MKELSIEEKAKRYDEAKLRMSAAYNSNRCTIGFMNEIFPELKESEDERIRKALIEMVHDTTCDELWVDYNVHKEDALDWLEKQGDQKPIDKVEPKFKIKYADSEYNVLEVRDIAGVTFYGIEDEPYHIDYVLPNNCEIVSEQKPAWSEEDESWFKEIELMCLNFSNDTDYREKFFTWLKDLKDRVQPQH